MTWRRQKPIARRTRVRKIGAGTHSQQVRTANELWRKLIYLKAPSDLCVRCHQRPWVEAAHFFAKGPYPSMRFDLDNGAPLCRSCHTRIDSDHKAKLEFAMRFIGPERYARLDLMSQARGKTDMLLTILYLREQKKLLAPSPDL